VVEPKLIWITLLVKLGVAAAVSSALARSRAFVDLLFAERRTTAQTLGLLAFICVPLSLGVWVRFNVANFYAADISFETCILLGILLGPAAATAGACLLALPAVLHHEFLALPFDVGVALIAGVFSWFVEKDEIWSFSPFIDLSIYQWVRRNLRKPRFDRQILLMMLIIALQVIHWWLAAHYPHELFALPEPTWYITVAVWACATMVVGIPLKIWNAVRIEQSLKEQKRLLLEARLDALQRQINPHFLFNTLNSIGSLVRRDPDQAREMIVKLANILRALLKDHDSFIAFREELRFTEDYLGIEVVRFGTDKLRIVKEIDPRTLGLPVPSMLLQPLVENSIKHGLEPRIHGGTVTLRSRLEGDRFILEVEDDGVGVAASSQRPAGMRQGNGVGMRNVRERLEVLFGGTASFNVISRPGRGTRVIMEMPVDSEPGSLPDQLRTVALPARSSTSL
jgi:two-component system LytT family sensor kinase